MTPVLVASGVLLGVLLLWLLWWVLRPAPGAHARVRRPPSPRQLYVQRLRETGDRYHAEFADILDAEPEQPDETGAELAARYRRYVSMRTVEFHRPIG